MKSKIVFSFLLFAAVYIGGCKSAEESVGSPTSPSTTTGDCPASQRTGANCNDGTTSTATGSGACSSHGGVKSWICK